MTERSRFRKINTRIRVLTKPSFRQRAVEVKVGKVWGDLNRLIKIPNCLLITA